MKKIKYILLKLKLIMKRFSQIFTLNRVNTMPISHRFGEKTKETTFNKLLELQLLIKKESGLKELCKFIQIIFFII